MQSPITSFILPSLPSSVLTLKSDEFDVSRDQIWTRAGVDDADRLRVAWPEQNVETARYSEGSQFSKWH